MGRGRTPEAWTRVRWLAQGPDRQLYAIEITPEEAAAGGGATAAALATYGWESVGAVAEVTRTAWRRRARELASQGRAQAQADRETTGHASVRVEVQDGDGLWRQPEPVPAMVALLAAAGPPSLLGTLGDDGRAALRRAVDGFSAQLAAYPGGCR